VPHCATAQLIHNYSRKTAVKTTKKSVYVPDALLPIAAKQQQKERYDSFSSYVVGLIIFDVYCKREHQMTGPLMREPDYIRNPVIEQLCAEYDTAPQRHGWFAKRIEELVAKKLAEHAAQSWGMEFSSSFLSLSFV
jgi:hypothetical protein